MTVRKRLPKGTASLASATFGVHPLLHGDQLAMQAPHLSFVPLRCIA